MGCVLDESGTDGAECIGKVASGRRVDCVIGPLDLQLECTRILHETFLVPVLTYDSETKLRKEKERSSIKAVHMEDHRGLFGIRKIDRFPNAPIRELCEVTKGVGEMIDGGFLRWFGHVERMERDRITKRAQKVSGRMIR